MGFPAPMASWSRFPAAMRRLNATCRRRGVATRASYDFVVVGGGAAGWDRRWWYGGDLGFSFCCCHDLNGGCRFWPPNTGCIKNYYDSDLSAATEGWSLCTANKLNIFLVVGSQDVWWQSESLWDRAQFPNFCGWLHCVIQSLILMCMNYTV